MSEEDVVGIADDVRQLCDAVKELLERAGYGVDIMYGRSNGVFAERSNGNEAEELRASCGR